MTETKIYCDHCGKELDTMKDFCDVEFDLYTCYLSVDLCVECHNELKQMVKQFCNKGK